MKPVERKSDDKKQLKLAEDTIASPVERCVDFGAQSARFKALSDRLWGAADEMRANSSLKSSDYSTPVLGLIFLRYVDYRFGLVEDEVVGSGGGRRKVGPADYHAKNVLYLTPEARYRYLLDLPEGADVGRAIDNAMRDIEAHNPDLRGVLPKIYAGMERRVLVSLLKTFNFSLDGFEGDVFGKIYEYFLGKFAMAEGQRAGEFFTPTSIVKLIVNVIEPYRGRILDPACGSGGMFVQSAEFVREHQRNDSGFLPTDIMIFGQERVSDTVNLCKMNLAVHGLSGDIQEGNTYYEDKHDSVSHFDFVMANPPFNVNNVDKEAIKKDPRFKLIPTVDNANYLWIQAFYSALNETGRAGFVMANSANDAHYSEQEIRQKLIEEGVVDVVISVATDFFYTVKLPITLWFLNKNKKTEHRDKILFIDARNIYYQIDKANREFTDQQIEYISNIVRLYREEEPEMMKCSSEMIKEHFPELKYNNVKGLCKLVSINRISKENWSLNPGRYIDYKIEHIDNEDFIDRLKVLQQELSELNEKSTDLENKLLHNLELILEGN